jgi:hypothetical protein
VGARPVSAASTWLVYGQGTVTLGVVAVIPATLTLVLVTVQ